MTQVIILTLFARMLGAQEALYHGAPCSHAAGSLLCWVTVWESGICLWLASFQAVISADGWMVLAWAAQLLTAKQLVAQDPKWAPEGSLALLGECCTQLSHGHRANQF